jgi:hypothetical protein
MADGSGTHFPVLFGSFVFQDRYHYLRIQALEPADEMAIAYLVDTPLPDILLRTLINDVQANPVEWLMYGVIDKAAICFDRISIIT